MIYKKLCRGAKNGILQRIFAALHAQVIIAVHMEALALDSTSYKVHPDRLGALKPGNQAYGKSRGGWNTKLHMVSAYDEVIVEIHLSSGGRHSCPEVRITTAAIRENFDASPF